MAEAKTIEDIKRHIAENRLREATDDLLERISKQAPRLHRLAMHVSRRLAALEQQQAKGVVSAAETELEAARIGDALLYLGDCLAGDRQVEMPPHLKAYFQESLKPRDRPFQWAWWSIAALLALAVTWWAIQPMPVNTYALQLRLHDGGEPAQPISGGKVQLLIGGRQWPAREVSSEGEVVYADIPGAYRHDTISLALIGMRYRVDSQSHYTIAQAHTGSIAFRLVPLADTTLWRGTVSDARGRPSAGVRIDVESGLAEGVTDEKGRFQIAVPRAEGQTVRVVIWAGAEKQRDADYAISAELPTHITLNDR
jgi:hypothetical protein